MILEGIISNQIPMAFMSFIIILIKQFFYKNSNFCIQKNYKKNKIEKKIGSNTFLYFFSKKIQFKKN
jgi:hypothetical protein